MLTQSSNSNAPETKTEPVVDFTAEDIEKLFQIITNTSYDKTSYLSGSSALIRQNFLNIISTILFGHNSEQFKVQARIFTSQLEMLANRNLFNNIFTKEKLQAIKNDLLKKGIILTTKIPEEDREAFLANLIRIKDEAQPEVPNMIPAKLQTGLGTADRHAVVYSAKFFQSKPSVDLFNRGVKLFQEKKWQEALGLFEHAIQAEQEMAEEFKKDANQQNLATYKKHVALCHSSIGFEFYNDDNYEEAIVGFKQAAETFTAIPNTFISREESYHLDVYQRNLALAYNYAAIDYYFIGNISQAVNYHQLALNQFKKIPAEHFTEMDENALALYQRNLAYVLKEQGIDFYSKNNLTQAIQAYENAEANLQQIKPELFSEGDARSLQRIKEALNRIKPKPSITPAQKGIFSENKKPSAFKPILRSAPMEFKKS